MNFYNNLVRCATTSDSAAVKLSALKVTLDHFGVWKDRQVVGEAILKFNVIKDHNLKFDPHDRLLGALIQMDAFFTKTVHKPMLRVG